MKKLFYEIRKLFWLRECGHTKLRGYLWQRLEQNLYRQRYMSVPAYIADNLEAEEQWVLEELCDEYIPGNSRELYHLLMSCQGFPGVWTADALLKAVHRMAKVGTLKPSDVLRLIEYRKAKLRGGTEIIAKVKEVIFDNQEFKTFFLHPVISLKDKKETIKESLGKNIDEKVLNFLETLLDENRLNIFNTIFELFKDKMDEKQIAFGLLIFMPICGTLSSKYI